jgi:hypothetical protein
MLSGILVLSGVLMLSEILALSGILVLSDSGAVWSMRLGSVLPVCPCMY